MGCFDNGSDILTRFDRSQKALLQLNGAGAGNLMNFFCLPNRSYSIREFLRSKYEDIDYSHLSEKFHKAEYFNRLAQKFKSSLRLERPKMSRWNIELIEPFIESKYWMGSNSSLNNQYNYALTPFADFRISRLSINVPNRCKNHKIFKMGLNRYNDERLARYNSVYGYNFYEPLPLKQLLYGMAKIAAPIWLRPLLRNRLAKKRRKKQIQNPFYLSKEYIESALGKSEFITSKFVNFDKIHSVDMLSRILTLEILLKSDY